jgi:hypothetical protein
MLNPSKHNSFLFVLEFRYKDETRIYDVQENSQAA